MIAEVGPLGMVTLRGEAGAVGPAVQSATGLVMPEVRRIVADGARTLAWMAPDEWLLVLPRAELPATLAGLRVSLAGQHALVVDVSDARAVFEVHGDGAATVLSRLCPVDFPRLAPDEIRRTRLAQVACALWRSAPGTFTVVAFRSVARYAFDVLANAAR